MLQQTKDFYQDLINNKLKQGYELLVPKIKQADFLNSTLEVLVSEETSRNLRLQILIIIRPVLNDTWSQQHYDSIKNDIRSTLLHGVVENSDNLKIVEAYALIINDIITEDGIQGWEEPLQQLIRWAEAQQPTVMEAGIDFFLTIFKDAINTELYKLSKILLPSLFQMFAASDLSEQIREKILILVLLVIRSFSSFDGNQDQIVSECFKDSYQIWMGLFLSALQGQLKSHLNMKRYILKSVTLIFRDMIKYSAKSLQNCLVPIWQFCYKVSHLYVWNVVFGNTLQSFNNEGRSEGQVSKNKRKIFYSPDMKYLSQQNQSSFQNQIQALAHQAVEFLSTVISIPSVQNIVRVSSYHLVNCLFNFAHLSKFQVSNWTNNPQMFMPYLHSSEDVSNLRSKSLAIINQLIQRYQNIAIQAILLISEKYLLDHTQNQTTVIIKQLYDKLGIKANFGIDTQKLMKLVQLSSYDLNNQNYSWRKIEVALVTLGRFSQDIIVFQSKNQTSFDIQSFVTGLMKQIQQPSYLQLLKGQAILCITRYIEIISIKHKQLFPSLIKTSCAGMGNENQIPVRTISLRSFSMFSRKIQKYSLEVDEQFFKENKIVEHILSLPLSYETISFVMEALIQLCKLSKSQRLILTGFGQHLLGIFKLNSSSTINNHVFNLIGLISNQKQGIQQLYKPFEQFINDWISAYTKILQNGEKPSLKQSDISLTKQVLRLLGLFVEKAKEMTFGNIQLLPSFLKVNDEAQLHIEATIALKNYIKLASSSIIKNNFTPKIIEVIHSLLEIPKDKSFQSASLYAGNLIILTFNNLLNGVVDLQILKKVVLKVFKSRTPSVIQSLILVYARIINSSGDELSPNIQKLLQLIQFLASFSIENRMALKILIDKWLLQQSLFRGKHTKCATFMALAKLFVMKQKKIQNLLVIGFNPSHTNINSDVQAPLKILSTLIRCLGNQCTKDSPNDSTNPNSIEEQQNEPEQYQMKEDTQIIDVQMQKFKDQQQPQEVQIKNHTDGGLGDRQNQGSTCYMSAMLEFYDDGEQCDQTTEDDLQYLQDISTKINLVDFLRNFFMNQQRNDSDYFNSKLKGLLKSDILTLNKHVKTK